MVRKLNHYKVLGVAPNASEIDVKRAYRSLVRTAHPDKGGSAERFQRIQKSYELILQKINTTNKGKTRRTSDDDHVDQRVDDKEQQQQQQQQRREKQEGFQEGRREEWKKKNEKIKDTHQCVKSDAPYSWRAKTILRNTNKDDENRHERKIKRTKKKTRAKEKRKMRRKLRLC
jgi:curved DNA-binding protein CbpA